MGMVEEIDSKVYDNLTVTDCDYQLYNRLHEIIEEYYTIMKTTKDQQILQDAKARLNLVLQMKRDPESELRMIDWAAEVLAKNEEREYYKTLSKYFKQELMKYQEEREREEQIREKEESKQKKKDSSTKKKDVMTPEIREKISKRFNINEKETLDMLYEIQNDNPEMQEYSIDTLIESPQFNELLYSRYGLGTPTEFITDKELYDKTYKVYSALQEGGAPFLDENGEFIWYDEEKVDKNGNIIPVYNRKDIRNAENLAEWIKRQFRNYKAVEPNVWIRRNEEGYYSIKVETPIYKDAIQAEISQKTSARKTSKKSKGVERAVEKPQKAKEETDNSLPDWTEQDLLYNRIKTRLENKVMKDKEFKKNHKYLVFNEQTGKWERNDVSVSQVASEIYRKGVWGTSEDDLTIPVNESDPDNVALALGSSYDKIVREYWLNYNHVSGTSRINPKNHPNYDEIQVGQIKENLDELKKFFDARYGEHRWKVRIEKGGINVAGRIRRGKKELVVAGEIDILVQTYDNTFDIYDIKTWNKRNTSTSSLKVDTYAKQQALYKFLFEQIVDELNPLSRNRAGMINGLYLLWAVQSYPGQDPKDERYEIVKKGKNEGQVLFKGNPVFSHAYKKTINTHIPTLLSVKIDKGDSIVNVFQNKFTEKDVEQMLEDMTPEDRESILEGSDFEELAWLERAVRQAVNEILIPERSPSEYIKRMRSTIHPQSKIERMAHNIAMWFSSKITELQYGEDPSGVLMNSYPVKSFAGMDRQAIIKTPGLINDLINSIKIVMEYGYDQMEPSVEKGEMSVFLTNFPGLVTIVGRELLKNERFVISVREASDKKTDVIEAIVPTDEQLQEAEEETEEDQRMSIENMEGGMDSNEYADSEKSISPISRLSVIVKTMLGTIEEVDANGDVVVDEYGMDQYIDETMAASTLYSLLSGASTREEMFKRLKTAEDGIPWIRGLWRHIDPEMAPDAVKQLIDRQATQFFRDFCKIETNYYSSFSRKGKDGVRRTYISEADAHDLKSRMVKDAENSYHEGTIGFLDRDGQYRWIPGPEGSRGKYDIPELQPFGLDSRGHLVAGAPDNTLAPIFYNLRNSDNKAALEAFYLIDKALNGRGDWNSIHNPLRKVHLALDVLGFKITPVQLLNALSGDHLMEGYQNSRTFELLKGIRQIIYNIDRGLSEQFHSNNEFIYEPFDNVGRYNVAWAYKKVAKILARNNQQHAEKMARVNGKSYYPYQNATYIQRKLEKLKNGQGMSEEDYKKWFLEEYGKYKWFYDKKERHWNLILLWDLFSNSGNARDEIEFGFKVSHDNSNYLEMTAADYMLSMLSDFFYDNYSDRAIYRLTIAADKNGYEAIKYKKYTGELLEIHAHEQAYDCLMQEIMRARGVLENGSSGGIFIKGLDADIPDGIAKKILMQMSDKTGKDAAKHRITRDEVMEDKEYIFTKTGLSFHHLPFMNSFIVGEINPTLVEGLSGEEIDAFSKNIFDMIFNNSQIDDGTAQTFQKIFDNYMGIQLDRLIDTLDRLGLLQIEKKQIQQYSDEQGYYFTEVEQFKYMQEFVTKWLQKSQMLGKKFTVDENFNINVLKRQMKEYLWNNWIMKINTFELFNIDLATFETVPNMSKRNQQTHSSGQMYDAEAKIFTNGKWEYASDGYTRRMVLADRKGKDVSDIKHNVEAALRTVAERLAKDNKAESERLISLIPGILEKYDNINASDGQAYLSLTGLRKTMITSGQWDFNTMEPIYQRLHNGTFTSADLETAFSNAKKNFVYSVIDIKRNSNTLPLIQTGVQFKNSEMLLMFAGEIQRAAGLDSEMAAIYKFLEESHYNEDGTYRNDGIDIIERVNNVKVGLGNYVDINGLSPYRAYEKLKSKAYPGKTDTDALLDPHSNRYLADNVYITPLNDTVEQTTKPMNYSKGTVQLGSQASMIFMGDIQDTEKLSVTTKDGKTDLNGKDVKRRYFSAMSEIVQKQVDDVFNEIGIATNPNGRFRDNPMVRQKKISAIAKRMIERDSKYTTDDLLATSIASDGYMTVSPNNPLITVKLQSKILAMVRNALYKINVPGGSAVQASSVGASKKLRMVFETKDGKEIMTYDEFIAKSLKDKGFTGFGTKTKETAKAYREYLKENQARFKHAEAKVPMSREMRKLLTDPETGRLYVYPEGHEKAGLPILIIDD